jgi:hypothetical protein
MTATNHALTGAVVALVVKRPELALPLALISHFVADMIPHFEAGHIPKWLFHAFVALDCAIALALSIYLSVFLPKDISGWLMFGCMGLAVSPDLAWGVRYYKLRDIKKLVSEPMSVFSRYHLKIQWSETRQGAFVELPWLVLTLVLINILRQ